MKRERTNKNERKQRKCEKERKRKIQIQAGEKKNMKEATTARKQAFSTFSLIQNASCLHRRY